MFFTFAPGRIMYAVVFGPPSQAATDPAIPLWVWIVAGVILMSGRRHAVRWLARLRKPLGASGPEA